MISAKFCAQLRLLYIRIWALQHNGNHKMGQCKSSPSHMVVVLGSGGHTAEMMSLLRDINPTRYARRTYIISSGDSFSAGKAFEIENTIQSKATKNVYSTTRAGEYSPQTGIWDLKTVPRARRIHQPLYTTPFSSLWCLLCSLRILYTTRKITGRVLPENPDVIITNGPATAVIVIIAAYVLRFCGFVPLGKMKSIYVESWARVKTLSLSGKLLVTLGLCDAIYVQWELLADAINGKAGRKKVEWAGFLVN